MLKPRDPTSARGTALGPSGLQLRAGRLENGAGWQASFAVVGYPHEVNRGWLGPLLQAARDTDLALHIEPLPAQIAAD
ncbi:MAG: conjugal transfer protein TraC, partial [Solirubrobacterales bacterium]